MRRDIEDGWMEKCNVMVIQLMARCYFSALKRF